MKKLLAVLIILTVAFSLGATSLQKSYLKDSVEWKAAEALAIANGYNPPTSVSPATASEVIQAINRISESDLDENEKAFRDSVVSSLTWDPTIESGVFGMTPSVILAPEIYKQTAVTDQYSDYLFPVRDRLSALTFDLDFNYSDTFYGFVDYLVLSPEHDKQYDKLFGTNFDSIKSGFNTQHEGTLRAGAILGNDWGYASVQRSRQSMGYGKTGVMTLGDNFSRQDFMRFHTYSDILDYTLNLTLFNNMNEKLETVDFQFNGMHNVLSLHRFDLKLGKKVQLSITEGIAAYMDSTLDLRLFNPFLFQHGFNNYNEDVAVPEDFNNGDEANNIFAVEVGYSPIPHLRVRGELIFDQIQIGGEKEGDDARPNASGYTIGVDTAWVFGDMFLSAYGEFTSTTPFLYLNKKTVNGVLNPNFDYIFGVHDWWGVDEVAYGGYRFGCDAVVISAGASFGKIGSFLVDGSIVYAKHGTYGLGYKNSIINELGPDALNLKGPTGAPDEVEKRLEIKVDGDYSVTDYLTVSAGFAYVNVNNYRNEPGKKFTDLQIKLGAALDITEIFR